MKIIANSLPKSGTHLLIRLLELLDFNEHKIGLTGAMIRPTQRNPFKRYITNKKRCLCDISKCSCFSIDLDIKENRIKKLYLDKYLNGIKEEYFISAHIPYTKELDDYLNEKKFKVIFIIRDPRDVLLSYYNHQNRDPNYPFHYYFKDKTFEESYKNILEGMTVGKTVLAPLKDRIKHSQSWMNSNCVLSLKFEDLIGENGGGNKSSQIETIIRILEFLEIDYDDEKIEYLSKNVFYPKAETFYKGKIHRWKEEYSNQAKLRVNGELKQLITGLGYEQN